MLFRSHFHVDKAMAHNISSRYEEIDEIEGEESKGYSSNEDQEVLNSATDPSQDTPTTGHASPYFQSFGSSAVESGDGMETHLSDSSDSMRSYDTSNSGNGNNFDVFDWDGELTGSQEEGSQPFTSSSVISTNPNTKEQLWALRPSNSFLCTT
jgi:hypothetical protein